MKLTVSDVEHIARLARLELTDNEKEQYVAELSAILSYVERLQALKTGDVAPTAHITHELAALRTDEVKAADPHALEKLTAAFPAAKADLLAVPPVFTDYKE